MSLTPTQKKKARAVIATYCKNAVRNEPRIQYSQQRPFEFVDVIGTGWHTLDCSGFVICNYWNAGHDIKAYIEDPSAQKYSGYGNTWTMETWLRKNGKRVTEKNGYLIGDVAMYNGHTTICSEAGTGKGATWTSHGSEGGPYHVRLGYRKDLVGVWRHPAML